MEWLNLNISLTVPIWNASLNDWNTKDKPINNNDNILKLTITAIANPDIPNFTSNIKYYATNGYIQKFVTQNANNGNVVLVVTNTANHVLIKYYGINSITLNIMNIYIKLPISSFWFRATFDNHYWEN